MPEVKTIQFPNTPQGQQQKVLALRPLLDAGWTVVSETITPGQFKGGKACCLAGSGLACCGPLGAPLGLTAGSTEGTINVTLTREERWAAKERVEKELGTFHVSQSNYQKASAELDRAATNFNASLQAVAQLDGFDREVEEKNLADALARLINQRKLAVNARQQFIQALSLLQGAYTYALSTGAEVPAAPLAIDPEMGRLSEEVQLNTKRLDQESALVHAQKPVIRAAHSWHEASSMRGNALQVVNERARRLAEARAAADAAPKEGAQKAAQEVQSAERKLAKRQASLDKCSAELAEHESVLREAMARRNEVVSQLES